MFLAVGLYICVCLLSAYLKNKYQQKFQTWYFKCVLYRDATLNFSLRSTERFMYKETQENSNTLCLWGKLKHQRSPLDDWTRYGVRLPMFLGIGILVTTSSAVILSFIGYVNPAAIPIGISLACIGVWLIVEAFFKVDNIKCEEAAKYFHAKLIQNKWEEEMKHYKELLDSANKIPEEDIQQNYNILMQAIKQQCAISMINEELAKEGKLPVPDVVLPEKFPKSTVKRKYSANIPLNVLNNLYSSLEERFQKLSNVVFNSMPNIHEFGKSISIDTLENVERLPDPFNSSGNIPDKKFRNEETFPNVPVSFKTVSKNKKHRRKMYTSNKETLSSDNLRFYSNNYRI